MKRDEVAKRARTREDEYFLQVNRELIERRRAELAKAAREQERRHRKDLHWMKCPKCGHDLQEVDMLGILVDRCTDCAGLYFDSGELELLMECRRPSGFLGHLKRLVRR